MAIAVDLFLCLIFPFSAFKLQEQDNQHKTKTIAKGQGTAASIMVGAPSLASYILKSKTLTQRLMPLAQTYARLAGYRQMGLK
jgi:hypothetical protein